MSLPSDDPVGTKLRLILERYKREEAQKNKEQYEAREARIKAYTKLHKHWMEKGYCAGCESPLDQCNCVWLAGFTSDLEDDIIATSKKL